MYLSRSDTTVIKSVACCSTSSAVPAFSSHAVNTVSLPESFSVIRSSAYLEMSLPALTKAFAITLVRRKGTLLRNMALSKDSWKSMRMIRPVSARCVRFDGRRSPMIDVSVADAQ
jgi:hypothetical protein